MTRAAAIPALAYLAAMTVWIYAVWNAGAQPRGALGHAFGIALVALHVGAGAGVGRWWALLLPALLVPVAVPAGFAPGAGQDDPIWMDLVLEAPFAALLIALGVGARKLRVRRR